MKPNTTSAPPASLPSGTPRYFHLLWDAELDDLRPVLESVQKNRDRVLEHWYQLYVLHFADTRALTRVEFMAIFGGELDATLKDLLDKDMDRFAADIARVAEDLAERGVPFSELIVSIHLFEESAATAFPSFPPVMPRTYHSFDKLSHIRMIVLADTYFRSKTAVSGARILALEREAGGMPNQSRSRFHGLVGASAAMRQLYDRVESAGATRGTILIVGESGTGKELVAHAIHECGPQPAAPFVALNCAAIPRDLIESELFGYKRGAFSGANTEYLGLFRAAEGGTLFLDEVTEMSADTQSKLLRALQERTVRPVGSTKEIAVDVRLIASTNREPQEAVEAGRLRDDLYYRLQAGVIHIPPLRERAEDVALLVEHFIELFNARQMRAVPVTGIENEALEAMRRYSWPGNVRELANAIETAFTFSRSPVIRLPDLPASISGLSAGQSAPIGRRIPVGSFADAEQDLIRGALEATEGNKLQAAKLLKISRKKLYAKIAKYGIE
ncbi:MAG: sigma-54 dependent transcriptional regulator [Candidatus Binatus sp.]